MDCIYIFYVEESSEEDIVEWGRAAVVDIHRQVYAAQSAPFARTSVCVHRSSSNVYITGSVTR
jgi:hypothetical protein